MPVVDLGVLGKLGMSAASPVTQAFDFVMEDLVADEEVIDAGGIRGTRDPSVERLRPGLLRVGGPIKFKPTPLELVALLPWMLGGTPVSTSYPLAETLPLRYVTIDRGSKVYTYAGVAVDSWTLSCKQGEAMELELNLIGQTETVGNSGTFPALTIDTTTAMFVFSDCVFNINALSDVKCPEWSLSMDNGIDKDRFFNSRTLTAVNPTDRVTKLVTRVPTGDYNALYNAGLAQTGVNAGVAASIALTNGASVLTLTAGKVTFPRKAPNIDDNGELFHTIEGILSKSGASTPSLATTLVNGP